MRLKKTLLTIVIAALLATSFFAPQPVAQQVVRRPIAVSASFNPSDFLAGLGCFYDADRISGNDSDPVVDWLDLSGNNKHYGQDTSANQPTLKKNIVNGHAVVRFATNDFLTQDPNPCPATTANTLIIVCTPSSTASTYILGGDGGEGTPAIISGFSSTAFEYYNFSSERATFASSASGFHILAITRTDDTGNFKLFYDGTEVVSTAVNTTNDWNGRSWQEIGNNGNAVGDNFYNGDIAMIIKFDQNHAGAAGLTNLFDALRTHFGTP